MTDTKTWVKFEKTSNTEGKFTMAPLEPGMGITIGNAMRRVLLSSIEGSAITAVTIEGVEHEFSTLPNVEEDVLDIICNLKGIIFKSHSKEPKTVVINYKGKGAITAADIEHDADIEIINKKHHIAQVNKDSKVKMDLIVERGIGYSPSEAQKKEDQNVNTICIDASFSPIVKVNPTVSKVRVGRSLDYDSLETEIWTDGSIDTEDAVRRAATILTEKIALFGHMNDLPEIEKEEVKDETPKGSKKESALNLSIDDLELSARSLNCLKKAGIETVGELIAKDLSELIQIKNFGKKSAEEINDKLKQFDLSLKGEMIEA